MLEARPGRDLLNRRVLPYNFAIISGFFRIIDGGEDDFSAKMTQHKKSVPKAKKTVDAFREKRRRGRPYHVRHSEVVGRAENYRGILGYVWSDLCGPLVAANSIEHVIEAFEKYADYAREFVPRLAEDILKVIHEPKFPKRQDPQINFLADSLAGRPNVEPRTSRDICTKHRAAERDKSPHKIIRKEFYVECSCGYKGPALNDACRKCGAKISYLPEILSNP